MRCFNVDASPVKNENSNPQFTGGCPPHPSANVAPREGVACGVMATRHHCANPHSDMTVYLATFPEFPIVSTWSRLASHFSRRRLRRCVARRTRRLAEQRLPGFFLARSLPDARAPQPTFSSGKERAGKQLWSLRTARRRVLLATCSSYSSPTPRHH